MANIRKNKKAWKKYLISTKFICFPNKKVKQYGKYLGCFWYEDYNNCWGKFLTTSW